MLEVYEITANGLPYKVQLSPEAANKMGAIKVKSEPTPEETNTPAKKASNRAKSTASTGN